MDSAGSNLAIAVKNNFRVSLNTEQLSILSTLLESLCGYDASCENGGENGHIFAKIKYKMSNMTTEKLLNDIDV